MCTFPQNILEFHGPGFKTMLSYIYSGKTSVIEEINDLDLLFQLYILADKVRAKLFPGSGSASFGLVNAYLYSDFWIQTPESEVAPEIK
jgi:hypothetical protein